ncbi:hypothetical protein SLINC_0525 [Streptomyces lincolnensis]|uniref:Uncharacterized protein n=1 Tax=Streptomyces lincolnensis TaxID=1915 RepID=A0A1B1M244_STRLN|nr:1,4-alpha-glucan branching protein [Streptomyces lincolnensis]ANS62749.1 hypothetical protein SLINC_0525 [Streptomyces lincolnensis]AXG51674.1 hypothetical protein SLCG_0519 [Streptomyces lincolnensis]QMV04693.1 1,4-alpha-glucan branching protein [Streptomyces lincolnensis]
MAIIHRTTLKPTKLELLTAWLPTRPWYSGGGTPELTKAGGFRLDDPQVEVGIEFMVVTDTSGTEPCAYLVPLTYRGAPLEGAEHALIGTMEHGVLGPRWAYDGCHDPVLVEQLLAFFEGRAEAQAQSVTDTPDREVTRSCDGPAPSGLPTAVTDDDKTTELSFSRGAALRLHRVLRPAPDDPSGVTGRVTGAWNAPDGTRERETFAVLHSGTES